MRLASLLVPVAVVACQKSDDKPVDTKTSFPNAAPTGSGGSAATPARPRVEQIKPKLDLKTPPADAVKTSSGLIYKKLISNDAGDVAARNDTVLINYTGWRQATGETFFSNRASGQPMPLNLAQTAIGFTEAMQLVKQGESAMLWVPPEIGYKGPPHGKPETLVYEVEVVGIVRAPEVPPDYKAPPATARTLPSGAKFVVVKAAGGAKPNTFDTVTFNYSAWDATGRMFDSTETRKRPAILPPYRQSAVMEDVLTSTGKGDRVRFWVDAKQMAVGGKSVGLPDGLLCYEVVLDDFTKPPAYPPRAPADVAAPPAGVKKTERGVFHKLLKAGKGGPKPKPTETVKVNYTGWTTDGRMFDSSVLKGEPAEFALNGVIAGWTDGIPTMSVGDKVRFWIPEELAYKGSPGKPQGMLVFDVELLEIKAAPPPGHGHDPHAAPPPKQDQPAPPDVAAPPKDAKKSPKGVFYKILSAKKGAAHPTAADTVKVHYTGWTTDGKQFDSSLSRGQPIEFRLTGVIAGWTDGIPMMGVGEKARFWIPEELAYPGGEPAGMLVFDVELIEIKAKP